MDEETFYATFYCASVTRCYPGRSPSGRGDRTPTPREQELCAFWREEEIRLLRPTLVVTVGGLAARRVLGIRRLTECNRRALRALRRSRVPLPHPSGASGWLNDRRQPGRRDAAVELVLAELASLAAAGTRREASRPRST